MKNSIYRFRWGVLGVCLIITLSVISLGNPTESFAREDASFETSLLQKLDLITSALLPQSTTEENSTMGISLSNKNDMPNPSCTDNWDTWPMSNTFNASAPWSTNIFYSGYNSSYRNEIENSFLDVNGDGLMDYLYYSKYAYVYNNVPKGNVGVECLLLNNGAGWDVAYRCFSQFNSTTQQMEYYGDCADTSS